MVTTSRAEWAVRARRLREHAMSVSAADRHGAVLAPAEEYTEIGFNFRMTDLQAAVGIVQLGRLDEVVLRRRELAREYQESLADVPGIRCVTDPEEGESNFQSFWVEVLEDYPLSRDALLADLADRGISARRGIMAAHRQPAYRDAEHGPLPVTDRLTDNTLILPVFHELSTAQQRRVIDAIRDQ
jgi:dTDP-4-amino-4,6-dideoxygalactose transaminase